MEAAINLAENWLNLKRLDLQVYTDNPAAIHLYEKYGFQIEGTLRRCAFRDGEYVDAFTMARVKE
jgi:putative acetyltransferase